MWVPKDIDWTTKPPCGTPLRTDGHWSVHGMSRGCLLSEGAGTVVHDLLGFAYTTNVNWANAGLLYTHGGAGVMAIPGAVPVGPYTIIWVGTVNNTATDTRRLVSVYNSSTPGAILGPSTSSNYSRARFVVFNTSGVAFTAQTSISMQAGNRYVLCGVFDGAYAYCYVNGVLSAKSSAFSGTIRGGASYTLYDGKEPVGTTPIGHVSETILVYNRAPSPQEIASISANPYQVCQP